MSVPNQTPYIIYNANGLTTVFPFEFYIINAGDIQVSINGTTVTSGYSVSGTGNVGGGDVTFLTPPASGSVVMLERVVPTYRLTDYQDNGDLLADTVNKDFDRLWMAIQRSFIYLGLALRRPLLGGPFDAEGYRISHGAEPIDKQDFATKNYVDNVSLVRALRVPEPFVSPLPSASQRANKIVGMDSNGNPIMLTPESGSAADVLLLLASPTGYQYIPSIPLQKWRDEGDIRGWGAKCNGVNDDSQAIMEAFSETSNIKIPAGKECYLADPINTPRDFSITGNNSILRGDASMNIINLPTYNGVVTGSIIQGVHFAGVGCRAINVLNDGAGSGFFRYIPRLSVRDCHVYWDLDFGIDGNLIFADIFNTSFGYIGDDPVNKGGLKAIRSNAASGEPNNPNFNRIRKCYFYNGSADHPQIEWFRGGQLSVEDSDFEGAGQCIVTNNTYSINLERLWLESCKGGDVTIKLNNVSTSAVITKSKIYRCGGTTGGVIGYNSDNMNSLTVSHCDFENENNYPIFNQGANGSAAIKIPSTNCIRWFDNRVVGADPAVAYNSSYNYHGPNTPRAYVRFNMATGTVISSSVPVTLIKQSTGSYVVSFPNYLGVANTSNLGVTCSVFNGYARVSDGGGATASQILVNAYLGGTATIFDSTDVTLQIM